jgi:hypothetical protein
MSLSTPSSITSRVAAGVVAALLAAAPALRAQDATAERDTSSVCLGFAFGGWTPPLDWRAAKHSGTPDSSSVGHAPGGRGWADGDGAASDTTLMLFPGWWPVGVAVALPTRSPARGDTVSGIATALVADGRVRNPTARVRAWRIRCGEPNRSDTANPAAPVPPHRRTTRPVTH